MPLVLVTGPANAAKAGEVFARYRALLDERPLLVVPTAADAEHYARELAAAGVVVGTEVVHFGALVRAIAQAAGVGARPLSRVARERVVRAVVRDAKLGALARSAAAPGFAPALGDLFAELGRELVTPGRFISALRRWRADAYGEELGALFGAYHRRLERLGAVDQEGLARAALDALRERPAAWERRPVLWYGFDDLTRTQFDAVETLALRAEAEVVVALPWEAGRAALAGCARTVEDLRPLASEHVVLEERSEHYAAGSREALHHLERSLFEERAGQAEPGDAVRLLEAGGARAEAELVGATVLELLAKAAPEEVAVVLRGDAERPLFEQVLTAYGVPVTQNRRVPLLQTRLGAGVAAMVRAAGREGTAADLVAWLRTPGKLADPDAADRLEAAALRAEARRPGDALEAWRRAEWGRAARGDEANADASAGDAALIAAVRRELEALRAILSDPLALLDAITAEAERVWTAPHARQAVVFDPEDAVDARAAAELRAAAGELRRLAEAEPRLLRGAADVLEALGTIEVRAARAGLGVLLADPLAIRARRFRAVVVCGLQDGQFPQRPAPDPFLPDDDRRALAAATDLRLPMREDVLARERSLFYACASRPEETLVLSFRSSTEEGDPLQPSPFVEDVRAVFSEALWDDRRRRLLADVTWSPKHAPTPHELRRAYAAQRSEPDPAPLGAPATDAVLAELAAREEVSARELEAFAGCGVRWVIERMLKPAQAQPDSIWLRRGALEHSLLERTLERLRDRLGSARLHPGSAAPAVEELDAAVEELAATTAGARAKAELRGVQLALARVLRHEAEHGAQVEPAELEWSFAPVDLGTIHVTGRVDRVDVDTANGTAIVRDYKRRGGPSGTKWAQDRRIQVALYALAVREQLGVEPVAAVFQPLTGDLRPRGLIRDGEVGGAVVETDRLDAEAFAQTLTALEEVARETGADLRAGRVRACPSRCTPKGACAYPAICRAGEGDDADDA